MRLGRLCLVIVLGLLAGCSGADSSESVERPAIRVGVLPDQSDDRLRSQYDPLMAHLEAVSGVQTELVVPSTYDDLLDLFAAGEVDLAWFGGLSFLQAERDSGARPLVVRDVDLEFTTDFIAASSTSGEELVDFAGATLAFGPELSTSGHLMPRWHLMQEGLDPEAFFAGITHSDGHDQTALWVQDGTVTLGAVNSVLFESLLSDGVVSGDRVRLVERTRPYRNYVWATTSDMSDQLRTRLLDGFLGFDLTDPEHVDILAGLGAGGFLPATASDFTGLRDAAQQVGMLEGDDQ